MNDIKGKEGIPEVKGKIGDLESRRAKGSTGRIRTFDILRGTSILLMIIAHIGSYWLTPDSQWLVALFFLIVNVQGTSGFTFVAGLGFGYSWWRHLSQSSESNIDSRKINNGNFFHIKRSLIRTFLLFAISIGFNLISALVRKSPLWFEYLWYWNILQTIAVCRLLGELLLQFKIRIRLLILIVMIPMVYFLTFWIVPDLFFDPAIIDSELKVFLFYLLYNPLFADGLLFFLPFFIMGTVAGELIWKNRAEFPPKSKNSNEPTNFLTEGPKISPKGSKILRLGIITGISLMIVGIGLGFRPVTYDYGWNLLNQINTHPNIQWEGIPLFLIANSGPWILYSLGFELLFMIFIFTRVDTSISITRGSKIPNRFHFRFRYQFRNRFSMVELFGRFSLSIYLGHYVVLFLPWFQHQFTAYSIWIPLILFISVNFSFAWCLNHPKFRSLSLEFQMQKLIQHYNE